MRCLRANITSCFRTGICPWRRLSRVRFMKTKIVTSIFVVFVLFVKFMVWRMPTRLREDLVLDGVCNSTQPILLVHEGSTLSQTILTYLTAWVFANYYKMKVLIPNLMATKVAAALKVHRIETMEKSQIHCTRAYINWVQDAIGAFYYPFIKEEDNDHLVRLSLLTGRGLDLEAEGHVQDVLAEYLWRYSHPLKFHKQVIIDVKIRLVEMERVLNVVEARLKYKDPVLVGVHVRRRGYARYLRERLGSDRLADERYLQRAVAKMRFKLFQRNFRPLFAAFLVVGDDPDWCQNTLIPLLRAPGRTDSIGSYEVLWAGNGDLADPVRDVALLASCHHLILTHGTLGLWAALNVEGLVLGPGTASNSSARDPPETRYFREPFLRNWFIVEW